MPTVISKPYKVKITTKEGKRRTIAYEYYSSAIQTAKAYCEVTGNQTDVYNLDEWLCSCIPGIETETEQGQAMDKYTDDLHWERVSEYDMLKAKAAAYDAIMDWCESEYKLIGHEQGYKQALVHIRFGKWKLNSEGASDG